MVVLQVLPEEFGEHVGQSLQGRVVNGWLPLAQVVDEQITDQLARDVVSVDEFLAGSLSPGLAEGTNARRGVGREDPGCVEKVVGQELALATVVVRGVLDIEEFDAVSGHNLLDQATFGGQDDRDALKSEVARNSSWRWVERLEVMPQSCEPLRVPRRFHEPRRELIAQSGSAVRRNSELGSLPGDDGRCPAGGCIHSPRTQREPRPNRRSRCSGW
ncbi:hypothetical protein ACIPJS_39040 [Streptomyces sp. NPDC086783]|uniref:hypothetical protein n=1 Tax=Streptomyces sp. NPDC086783 TaxID=3365758 RepID=UPI00380BCA2B